MKIKIYKVLLMGGLFVLTIANTLRAEEVVYKDKMIYKVGQSVFSLQDLDRIFHHVQELKCMYDDSLLYRIFKNEFTKSNARHYTFSSKLSEDSKNYFKRLLEFSTLQVYARSQNVAVDENIVKFLYLSAKNSKCSMSNFSDAKTLKPSFREILRLEIFTRSRFLPTDKGGKTTDQDLDQAISSARNLLTSISKQIEFEVYW